MISRIALSLFLAASVMVMVSAQSPPKKLTKEGEQKKQEELRKKIKETLDAAVSEVALLKSPENKTFFQVRIACLLWSYDEKGARLLLDDAQDLTASMINDPKINIYRSNIFEAGVWEGRIELRSELVSMIAQRDPQAALEFLQQTKFVMPQNSMQGDRAKRTLGSDASLEYRLALQVAKNDPKRALEMAEESLKKGISSELNELVRVVFEKDKEAGKKLAGAVLSNLKSIDITANPHGLEVALHLLEGEYASRRPESAIGENISGNKKRRPVLDDQALREWNHFIIQAILTMMGKGAQTHRERLHFIRDHLSNLMRLLPEIEKLSPTLVTNFKQRYGQLIPKMDPEVELDLATENAKAEEILPLAIKSRGELRQKYLEHAVRKALDSEGNFELARKIADEYITDPDKRKALAERIEEKVKQHFIEHGKIEDAAASLVSLESDAERAAKLADLAGRALKSGNKKLAAELLEKALGFLLQPVETKDEYEAMIRILHNSIEIDRERSFEMFDSLIEPINQVVTATIQFIRFEGKRSDPTRDEIPLYDSRGDFPVKGFVEVIVPLSKADFDRAIGLADRIRQPELKLQMKLLAIQAITVEQ